MSDDPHSFVSAPALEIVQPLGVFYVTRLTAESLLQVAFSDPLRVTAETSAEDLYPLAGAQRTEKPQRLRAIADFIETAEAAFPNSIILGANYGSEWQHIDDESIRWRVENQNNGDCLQLVIPTNQRLARIIDGQHRLNGFRYAASGKRSMELLCAVYLDLPNTYQAFVFATINFNQKRVDRSLAYQLFGIGIDEENADTWSPEKTAVFISRKLNVDSDSPFHQRIIVAAQNEDVLFRHKPQEVDWAVSTATIVDGLLKLFSSKPQKDKDGMHRKDPTERSRSQLEDDGTPLRKLYLEKNDLAIYTIAKNFFLAVRQLFWSGGPARSALTKTVGIQALFDVLNLILRRSRDTDNTDVSVRFFVTQLEHASSIDFASAFFEASGRGRTRLKNTIALSARLIESNDRQLMKSDDYLEYLRITGTVLPANPN